jgi:hypothetical protein
MTVFLSLRHVDDCVSLSVSRMSYKITLLHATYRREGGPLDVKEQWLSRAGQPDRVEYIFAMDGDDVHTVRATEGHLRVVGPPGTGVVTSVRNWNSAAAASSGQVLMVIADDLLPPQDWDLLLDQLIEPLDPERISFVLKVRDSPAEQDALVRHPVVSRAYYRRHGLFSPEYRGVYCDSDISTRAFWHSTILDGRSLVLEHHHHTTDAYVPRSASQAMVNATEEYRHGLQTYNSSWTLRERSAPLLLVHTPTRPFLAGFTLLTIGQLNRCRANRIYLRRRAAKVVRLRSRLRHLRERLLGLRTASSTRASSTRTGSEAIDTEPDRPDEPR